MDLSSCPLVYSNSLVGMAIIVVYLLFGSDVIGDTTIPVSLPYGVSVILISNIIVDLITRGILHPCEVIVKPEIVEKAT